MSTTREGIVLFALGLISRKSFSSFSYDDISRQFNMTKAAVHYHFKGKEDLGLAICELLRERQLAVREIELAAVRGGRHPWKHFEERLNRLERGGICPIVSMQADFENLPERLRAAVAEVSRLEVENLVLLAKAYDKRSDVEGVVTLLMALKGALEYRRVMGEDFFRKTIKNIRKRFYEAVPERG